MDHSLWYGVRRPDGKWDSYHNSVFATTISRAACFDIFLLNFTRNQIELGEFGPHKMWLAPCCRQLVSSCNSCSDLLECAMGVFEGQEAPSLSERGNTVYFGMAGRGQVHLCAEFADRAEHLGLRRNYPPVVISEILGVPLPASNIRTIISTPPVNRSR